MPRVPAYEGPQVQTRALSTPAQSAPDVSSGLQAASRALGQVAQIAERRVLDQVQAEADTADAEISSGWLTWDAEARRKYQGANIGEYEAEAAKWWDKARETYGQNLTPAARERVGQALARKRTSALGAVASHSANVREQWADSQAEAAAQTTIEFGIDTGDTAGAAARVRQIAAEKGSRKGWSTEMVQAEQQRLLGTLHLSYITRLAQSNPEKARAYYDANKGEIPGAAQARVEEVLKAEGDNQFASQFAAKHAGMPLAEQLAKAGEISDPERREKTLQQVRNAHAQVQQAQREREQAASDEAWQMVGQGRRVPEATLMRMNGRERVQLQDYLRDRAKAAASGSAPKSDPAFLASLYDMARDNPDQFKQIRMEAIALKVSGSDMEQLAKLQRDMREPAKEKDSLTLMQHVGAYSKDIRVPFQRQQFEAAALREVALFQEKNNRPPNQKERTEILDALITDSVIEDSFLWFDKTKPTYQMTPEERAKAVPARKPAAPGTPEKFEVGRVYVDAKNNRARYLGGGKWEPVQ